MKEQSPQDIPKGQNIQLTDAGVDNLTNWGWAIERSTPSVVRFVRGRKMTSTTLLFDEFSSALQFPYYFGENWDGFEECLTDLEWLSYETLIVIITEAEYLFGSSDHIRPLFEILIEASEYHAQHSRRLVTILQSVAGKGNEWKRLFSDWSIDIGTFDPPTLEASKPG